MARQGYRAPIPYPSTEKGLEATRRDFVQIVGGIMQGKVNCVGDLTLTAGTSTTLNNPLIHEQSVIIFVPTNAAAAALSTQPYASTRGNETATITHATAAGTETFAWVAFG